MKEYNFTIKKEVRNNIIIKAKDEENAKKIFDIIFDLTNIIPMLLDDEVAYDISVKTDFHEIPNSSDDQNHEVTSNVDNKV